MSDQLSMESEDAVAFQLPIVDEGVSLHIDTEPFGEALRSFFKGYEKRILAFRTALYRCIFPASPVSLGVIVVLIVGLWLEGYDVSWGLLPPLLALSRSTGYSDTYPTVTFFFSYSILLWALFSFLKQLTLKLLLQYKGFMFEPRGKPSLVTNVWFMLVRFITGSQKAQLYSYQRSLPRQPVPTLNATCQKYLQSNKVLLTDVEFEHLKKLAKEFEEGPGKKLNAYLYIRSWLTNNYVTDWWDKHVYMLERCSLLVNKNYYVGDIVESVTSIPAARAGMVCHVNGRLKEMIETQTLPPVLINGIPLCSALFSRAFGTTRIPGIGMDELQHTPGKESDHVLVYHSGRWYTVSLYHKDRLLTPVELEWTMQWILDDSAVEPRPGEAHLAALTTADRTTWARAREKYFSTGVNRASMEMIEKAAFVLVFEDLEPSLIAKDDDNKALTEYCKDIFLGNGYTRWLDKSITMAIYKNGKLGTNVDHSWADGSIISRIAENRIVMEDEIGYRCDGHNKGEIEYRIRPHGLQWDLPSQAVSTIETLLADAQLRIENVDMFVLHHHMFGKGEIKKMGISPDGFIQMAIQLSYYKDSGGYFCPTIEASMARMFLEGRTEAVRPVTMESTTFVRAMSNPESSVEERRELLKQAADKHATLYKMSMAGRGIDRHLFCLNIASTHLNIESPFLQWVSREPKILFTSQTPCQQTGKLDVVARPDLISTGGGFGSFSERGYSISYIIQGDYHIYFHIASFNSASNTSSEGFGHLIKESMQDMRKLFPTH